ncbi:hypothetical protein IQ07DRAFT_590606 [Pyrenochaeta sp. DS3sAY3a]|nr:hypothetical protein IQ07DRAFT_590606 [Pyrenochaeta sp. DS3sAY3a]
MAPKGKSAPKRKRQTKLNFSPGANPSPASKQPASPAMGSSLSRRAQHKPTNSALKPVKASKESLVFSSSEDELAVETEKSLQLGNHTKSTPLGMFDSSNMGVARSESDEEEKEEQIKSKRAGRKRRRAKDTDEEDSDEGTVTVIPRKRQRPVDTEVDDEHEDTVSVIPRTRQRHVDTAVDESDDDIEELSVPVKRRRTRRQPTSVEEQPQTPPRRSRRREPEREIPSEVEDEEDDEEEASEPSQSQPRRRRLTRRPHVSDEEEEEDAEEGQAGEESGKENSEDDDLKEDLAFLRSSPPPNRGRLRSTHDKPKSERQKALEALKQRRAGTQDPSSSATPARRKVVVVDSESDLELEVIKEEVDSDEDILDQEDDENEDEDEGDRDANILDMFQEDGEDAGFIDDDAEALIGEPSANADLDELRLALSLSRAKSKELFRHAVEWMVMKKIHPAFDSTANIYTLTFRKLDDEVKGLAGSKFTSSAWTADFTRSLRARPDILIDETTNAMRELIMPHCEACNRSNHTARFELMLTGQPYNAETLEPLDNNPDSDSDSDSSDDSEISADSETRLNGEKPTFDAQGERLPPESHRFPLGSTCKANAQVAHTLHHWRYHLYQWVKDYLAHEGHLTAEKLVKRDKSSDRKRQKEAMKIVDRMDSDGQVVKLYRQYKDQVKFALEAKNDYKAGWGR